ncbi:MAG: isoprenylcysteine carboxylmethyltransferase family protein [Betaproteobacteria bacterium]|nr:isoprenylcysteine carboxylmethyltransferase family protein [Betaproteobacteria bacterium]
MNLIFAVQFAAYIAIRGYFESRQTTTSKPRISEARGDRWLLAPMFVGAILLPPLHLLTVVLSFADYAIPSPVRALGVVITSFALWLFWASHRDLGRNWSRTLEIHAAHALVSSGVYAHVRHPMYTAILLFCAGQGLTLCNWAAGWGALAAFTLMLAVRLPREERMLLAHFGPAYLEYKARTGMLLPRIGSKAAS